MTVLEPKYRPKIVQKSLNYMIRSIIARKYTKTETQGRWLVMDGNDIIYACVCIELPNLNNKKKVSCIPEGVYTMRKITSPTKGECFLLDNVPDRTAIEVHIGNYINGKKIDSEGCILPGGKFSDINSDGFIDVANSTQALKDLLSILPDESLLYIL
jgi:hypothetical protein